MSKLDELKMIWKDQAAKPVENLPNVEGLAERLEKQRTKIKKSNWAATICMLFLVGFLSFLALYYDQQSWLFYAAIGGVIFISVVVTILLWQRSLGSAEHLTQESSGYIDYQLKRLRGNKLMIEYSPVYSLVLCLLINAYMYSLIQHGSAVFAFWAVNLTWFYIMTVTFLTYRYKQKKFKKDMKPLLKELERIKAQL